MLENLREGNTIHMETNDNTTELKQIRVLGIQQFPEGEEDRIEYMGPGEYIIRNGAPLLRYREQLGESQGDVTTLIRVLADKVVIHRWGGLSIKQEYQVGKQWEGLYHTPHGTVSMGILTRAISHCLTEAGGRIRLEYDLFLESRFASHNSLEIVIGQTEPVAEVR